MNPQIHQVTGKLTYILVREFTTGDFLDAEVIVGIDTDPVRRFGFRFGPNLQRSMLDILRDAFNNNWKTTLDYIFDTTGRDGFIRQVHISKETMMM